MIRSLRIHEPAEHDRADVCVVGAGAAGITLAVELAAKGKRVLLLEGGGPEIEADSQDPYVSEVVGLRHRGVHEGRFRAHGGTTHMWGGQLLELDREDFEVRPWVPGSGWPITRASLQPYYNRAYRLEGLHGVLRDDAQVWRELGIPEPVLQDFVQYFTRWTPDPLFPRLHRKLLESDAIQVWLHANAVGLEMENDVVRGVTCSTLEGKKHTFRADEFVFCLGSIESSRFFLQPRESGLPWNRDGLVGKNFQDHVDFNAAVITPVNKREFHRWFDNVYLRGLKYHPKLRLSPGVQEREQTLNIGCTMFFVTDIEGKLAATKGTALHLLRGRWGDLSTRDLVRLAANAPLLAKQTYNFSVRKRVYNPPNARIYLRAHCEQEPLGQSSITLADTKDTLGLYRTRIDWRVAESELRTMRVLVKTAQRSLASVAQVVPDDSLMSGDPSVFDKCDDSNHHMGGMRMAPEGLPGVVDENLLLRGTRNCYVGSAAVFPTSGFSNPTHTLLALMVRLADRLSA